jgi:hypothetical protein
MLQCHLEHHEAIRSNIKAVYPHRPSTILNELGFKESAC